MEATRVRVLARISKMPVQNSKFQNFCPSRFSFYSLSDSSLAITFATFLWQNVWVFLHYYVYVQIYILSQLHKMLILLISFYCKMCTLPTLQSRVFVCCEQYKHARSFCWQLTHFTMGPNEQNQHFAELRQKVYLYIHIVVLLTCLPSLDGKLECFVTKKWQKWLSNLRQTDYSLLQILIPATINSLVCQKGQFTLKLCPRWWFVRKIFGSYTPKVKIVNSSMKFLPVQTGGL